MAFCRECGTEITNDAKFCKECGCPTKEIYNNTKRSEEYVGKIYKCPNCGDILKSFEINCPSCGHEIRDTANSFAVKEFALKLASAKSKQEKISIIRNFPVPNTKEDILEFIILASTNIDDNLEKDISAAWKSKTEQAYQKALILFQDEKDISRIKSLYAQVFAKLETQKKIEKCKQIRNILNEIMPVLPNLIVVTGWLISIFILIPFCKINLDNVGTNIYQWLLILDFVAGATFVPFAFKCPSPLPKLITSLGLILSIFVLIPFCGKNLDNVGTNAFQLILIIDIICSSIILVRMFKQKHKFEEQKTSLNSFSFIITLICVATMLIIYGIGSIKTYIIDTKDKSFNEQEKHQIQNTTYEWPSVGINQYLPLPPTKYGDIKIDDKSCFNIEIYQVSLDDFENYVNACKNNGFTVDTTKIYNDFYAYNIEQYKLVIFYLEDKKTMDIFLDVPEKMSDFNWPTSKIAQKLPLPKSLIGRIWSDTSKDFGVNIANISQDDFSIYIDECIKKGFSLDYTRENDFFNAYNKDGDELTLHLQIFDVMEIYIETAENY